MPDPKITHGRATQAYEAIWNRLNRNHQHKLSREKDILDEFFEQLQDLAEDDDTDELKWLKK